MGDLHGDRPQHELAENHVVHDPLAVRRGPTIQHIPKLVGAERLEARVVDVEPGERLRDGLEERGLHGRDSVVGGHRGGDPAGHEHHLVELVLFGGRRVVRQLGFGHRVVFHHDWPAPVDPGAARLQTAANGQSGLA